MIAAISANSLIAIAAVVGVCLTGGAAVGRRWGATRKHRDAANALQVAADSTIQQLTWAVVGKPADQWGPHEPGLIEQMAALRGDFHNHVTDDARLMSALITRLDAADKTAASTAADAAKAAIDAAALVAATLVAHDQVVIDNALLAHDK